MIKLYYLLENSIKNLTRSSGILASLALSCLSSFIAFSFLTISLFFSHWHDHAVREAASHGGMAIMDLISPSGMLTTVFKHCSTFLAVLCLIVTLSAIRRLFFHMANDQRASFKTMSLLGETTPFISLEFSLQSIYVALSSLMICALSAALVLEKLFHYSLSFGSLKVIVATFHIDHKIHVLILLAGSLYIGCRVFLFVQKYLHSFFDNLKTELDG
ncbi:MAG: hypothetical protein L0L25_08825 [Enterococcus sp.]|nr:hypothetical protein [Enterococcus sp.]